MAIPNLCPNESDAAANVEAYIKDPEVPVLAGYMSDGIVGLADILAEGLARVEPESKTILIDRDMLTDNDIMFAKDLAAFLEREIDGTRRVNIIVVGDIPVLNWAVPIMAYRDMDVQLHYVSLSCKFVPISVKRM